MEGAWEAKEGSMNEIDKEPPNFLKDCPADDTEPARPAQTLTLDQIFTFMERVKTLELPEASLDYHGIRIAVKTAPKLDPSLTRPHSPRHPTPEDEDEDLLYYSSPGRST